MLLSPVSIALLIFIASVSLIAGFYLLHHGVSRITTTLSGKNNA